EALRCKTCGSDDGGELCDWGLSVTCSRIQPMCVRALFTRRGSSIRSCATLEMCEGFKRKQDVDYNCCSNDNCN
ncbi:unnamed protein product, partial [Pleuronectes platessa]